MCLICRGCPSNTSFVYLHILRNSAIRTPGCSWTRTNLFQSACIARYELNDNAPRRYLGPSIRLRESLN